MGEKTKTTGAGVVIRSGVWYTGSAFLTKGIAFITTPIFARLLSSNDFGEYSNFVAWAGIITIVATMDMYSTINRARYDHENLDGYLSSVALTGTIVTIILWGIVSAFSSYFCRLFSMNTYYMNALFITATVSPALQLLQAKNRINYKYKSYVIISIGAAVSSTIISVLLVLIMQNRLAARIIGQYGTVFLFDLCIYAYILYKGRQFKWTECRYALMICIPMIPHLLSKYILNQSDRIMIKQFCGASDTAFYSLAYNCAMIPIMLGTATNTAWSPWVAEMIHYEEYDKIRKMSYYYILFFFSTVVAIFLLGPEVILVLGGEKYAPAAVVLPPVVMGAVFQFLYNLYVGLEQFAKKTVGMAVGTAAAALINLALNWIFIPKYGYIAAAYTTLAGYVCLLIIHYFLALRTGYSQAYDIKFIFVTVTALFAFMFCMLWLYSKPPVIRYVVFAVLLAGVLTAAYKKRELISILRRKA